MQTRLKIVIGTTLVVAGCARFGHQTSMSEPHGMIRFEVVSSDVKTFDGLPVSAGEYRVKPGQHELVYRVFENRERIVKPVNLGVVTLPPTVEEQQFRYRYVTNMVLIEADWLYDVEGVEVKKTMFQGR
jgi:hypothetical protein